MSEKDTSPALEEASGGSPGLPAEESEPTPALVIDRFANMNVSPADDDDSTDHDDSHNSDQSDDDESDHPMSSYTTSICAGVS
jgi:hypothetical protein